MWIIIYRPHNALMAETQYIGVFETHDEAYEHLVELPALGLFDEEASCQTSGVKFIEALTVPTPLKRNIKDYTIFNHYYSESENV